MRDLVINNLTFQLEPEVADVLLASGAIYSSPEADELQLSIDHSFTYREVLLLLGAPE